MRPGALGSGAAVSHHTAPVSLGEQDAKGTQMLPWCYRTQVPPLPPRDTAGRSPESTSCSRDEHGEGSRADMGREERPNPPSSLEGGTAQPRRVRTHRPLPLTRRSSSVRCSPRRPSPTARSWMQSAPSRFTSSFWNRARRRRSCSEASHSDRPLDPAFPPPPPPPPPLPLSTADPCEDPHGHRTPLTTGEARERRAPGMAPPAPPTTPHARGTGKWRRFRLRATRRRCHVTPRAGQSQRATRLGPVPAALTWSGGS